MKWQGFETLPLSYPFTVSMWYSGIYFGYIRKRIGSVIIKHSNNKHEGIYG